MVNAEREQSEVSSTYLGAPPDRFRTTVLNIEAGKRRAFWASRS